MAKKSKEVVNVNNLRSAGFADFEANHEFTAESKIADFTRAAITAGLTNDERLDERLDEITLARKQNKSTANKIFILSDFIIFIDNKKRGLNDFSLRPLCLSMLSF